MNPLLSNLIAGRSGYVPKIYVISGQNGPAYGDDANGVDLWSYVVGLCTSPYEL